MKHITTHDHAPASFDQVEQLALDRAESDAFEVAQTFANCRKPPLTDAQKLADKLVECQKQADLDRAALLLRLNETEYQLHKAQAERLACVIALVAIVVLAFFKGAML